MLFPELQAGYRYLVKLFGQVHCITVFEASRTSYNLAWSSQPGFQWIEKTVLKSKYEFLEDLGPIPKPEENPGEQDHDDE